MTKNFPNLGKDANLQIQEAEQTPTKQVQRNSCQDIPQTLKNKDKNVESKEKDMQNYTGIPIQMIVNFLSEILEAKRKWYNIF